MKRTQMSLWTVASLLALGVLLGACSELKKDLGPPTSPAGEFHGAGWTDTASENFHGSVLKKSDFDNMQCVKCHGGDFGGGTSGVSCYGCHALYPHDPEWTTEDSDSSHGEYLGRSGYDTSPCTPCHGAGLEGGTSGVSCNSCHGLYPHPPEWTSPGTQGFHGVYLKNQQYDLTACALCHGSDFKGGSSGVSCYTCHASFPHPATWITVSSGASHGHYLKAKDWRDQECTSCHGANYTGGTSGLSCFTCHAPYPHSAAFPSGEPEQTHRPYMRDHLFPLPACRTCHGQTYAGGALVDDGCMESGCHADATGRQKSPEACNTCHGDFRAAAGDLLSFAPPKGVAGESLTSVPAVGAHTAHLSSAGTGKSVKCQECHAVPAVWDGPGHIDGGKAEVAFNDTLARLVTSNGNYRPQNVAYDPGTNRCSNTFCHGNWRASRSSAPDDFKWAYADSVIEGAKYAPVWTGGSVEAACGLTCHTNPPKGHQAVGSDDCRGCHPIGETTHINGKINALGTERNF